MTAHVKHFSAYTVETNRAGIDEKITTFDLYDSYLPQYEIAYKEGRASGCMCSYNEINGVPSCANELILEELVRKRWGRSDALVTSDCGAIENMANANHYA